MKNLNTYHGKQVLIKIGGSVLDNDTAIQNLCADIKILSDAGIKIILVHGGSKAINKYLSINNIESSFIDGLRVTSAAAMTVIEMVLCGHINKLLVRKLSSHAVSAVGISGADNAMLQCNYYSETHGYAGVVKAVDLTVVTRLISNNLIPVIAPVGVDAVGNAMNINADYVASHIAITLKVDQLIYLTDQDGIYNQDKTIYPELSRNELRRLINEKVVMGGMLVKAKSILATLNRSFCQVHILNGNIQNILLKKFFSSDNMGTICKTDSISHELLEVVL